MKKLTYILLGPLLAILAYALLSTTTVFAAGPYTCTWTGASNSNFNNAGNWSGCNSSYPQPGDHDNLIFDNTSLGSDANLSNNISNLNLTSITFQGNNVNDYSFTLDGNPINLSGGITDTMDAVPTLGSHSGSFGITLTGNQSFTSSGGEISIYDLNTSTYNLTTLDEVFVNTISGSGNVDVTSDQSPSLAGLNLGPTTSTYSGQISVENTAGLTLDFDGGGLDPMGTGSIVVKSGGSLFVNSSLDSTTVPNDITALSGAGGTNSSYGAITSCLGDSSGCTSDGNNTTVTLSGNVTLTGNTQLVNGAYYSGEPSLPANTATFDLTGTVSLNCYTLTALSASSTIVTLPGSTPTGCPASSSSGSGSGSSTGSTTDGTETTPKTPDTGVGLDTKSAVLPLIGTTIAAIGICFIGRKYNSISSKKH